jgi:O-antigen ligase
MMEYQDEYDDSATAPSRGGGLVLGLWLSGVFAASLGGWFEHGRDNTLALTLLGAAIVWPLLYFAVSRLRFVPRALPIGAAAGLLLFALAAALSSFWSPVTFHSTGYTILTLAGIWLALQFNTNLEVAEYERGLKVFAVIMTSLLLGFAWYDYVPGKRLGMGKEILNPNTIALVSTSALLSAMAIRKLLVRLAVMAPIGGIIVLTGSRAAAVGAVAGLAAIVWLRLRANGRSVLVYILIGLLLIVGVTIAYGDVLYKALDRFYDLSKADRGIGSGATGRVTAWKATWELFTRNPVLGVGFRAHEHLLKVDTSAHNGYLATLAEVGVIGFLGVLYLVVRGLRLLLACSREPERGFVSSALFGLCFAYLLLAVFERYLINVGNPTSLLFLLGVMRPGLMQGPVEEPDESSTLYPEESAAGEAEQEAYGHG